MTHDLRFSIRLRRVLLFVPCLSAIAYSLPTSLAAQTVTHVCAGDFHSIFVKSDGSLWGMGDNSDGQLGLGSGFSTYTNLPQQIMSGNVSAIASGDFHILILESNESLWATGANYNGELGDGNNNGIVYVPVQVVSNNVTGVASGAFHSFFTTITNETRFRTIFGLWATGADNYGQLGDGLDTGQDSPEQIESTELLLDIVSGIAGGYEHTLYVENNGSLWATGRNLEGELGDGTTNNQNTFEEIVSSNVVAVGAGDYHSLFVKSDGSLWAMGDNSSGELGDNSTNDEASPEQVGTNAIAVAGGYAFSLFIKSDGSLWGMGANTAGQLGDGTGTNQYLPVMIVPTNVVAVAAGLNHSFFIKSDGTLWAMGENVDGDLGDGTLWNRLSPVQVVPLVIPQPAITRISLATTNLLLTGTNAEAGRYYFTLMSTNLALPLSQWTSVATNFLTNDGPFTITATNAVAPNAPQAFYVLQPQVLSDTGP